MGKFVACLSCPRQIGAIVQWADHLLTPGRKCINLWSRLRRKGLPWECQPCSSPDFHGLRKARTRNHAKGRKIA